MSRCTRWLVLPGLLSALLLTAAVVLAVPLVFVTAGNQAMDDDAPLAAEDHYSSAMTIPIERWIAPFNRGVARYEQHKWDAAAADFELAALFADEEQDCMIRLNWSAALERGADALRDEDDAQGATVRYQQALLVLATSSCPEDEPADGSASMAQQQAENRERLSGKLGEQPPAESDDTEPMTDDDSLDELDERAAQAQQERQDALDREDPREGGSGERTW